MCIMCEKQNFEIEPQTSGKIIDVLINELAWNVSLVHFNDKFVWIYTVEICVSAHVFVQLM